MKSTHIPTVIEHWPVDRLVPYERNARTHSSAQIEQIVASIAEFGFTNPILVDRHDGILAGHARLRAARRLQLELVPVIVLDHLNDIQKRAYVLADNKLALNAGWDEELLAQEIAALNEADFDVKLTGFDDEELERLLAECNLPASDPDDFPEPPAIPVSRGGDTWQLGLHRLHCGDAASPNSFRAVLGDEVADMVFTDPPYNVNYQSAGRKIANDDLGDSFGSFLSQACSNLLEFSRGAVYICMSSSELHTLFEAFTRAGGHWSTFIVWAKNTFTLGRADYQRQYEPILYGWKQGSPHVWCGDRNQGDVWSIDKPFANKLHPTMKPVELVERAIRNSSHLRDIVLDPFGGSGTTLIACETTGRRARIVELDPGYVDVIIKRWQDLTGRTAILESDQQPFAAVSIQRSQNQQHPSCAAGEEL
jgi:DNA modification methylase